MTFGPSARGPRLTRRHVLKGAGGAAIYLAVGGTEIGGSVSQAVAAGFAGDGVHRFSSEPNLRPPTVHVSGHGVAPGYQLLGVKSRSGSQPGALILDDRGQPVWFRPLEGAKMWATNLVAEEYKGAPVLVRWEGPVVDPGFGRGEGVIVDTSYREIARIRAGNGRKIDLHELILTQQGTALFTCYPEVVPADLSSIGGPRNGRVQESIIQEVDVATGRLLWEWRGLDHIPVSESYQPMEDPYEYLHANSIQVAPDGNLLVSFRHAWAVHKIHRRTGQIMWRLGGKRSDFQMGPGARFAWQHHARLIGSGLMTVFDNGSDGYIRTEPQSRGLVLAIDEANRTVSLVRSYRHPQPLLAAAMGSVQVLPADHTIVEWGLTGWTSEFDANGKLIWDMSLDAPKSSYRVLRLPWSATPYWPPAIATSRNRRTGNFALHVSWNGATEVAYWQLLLGSSASHLRAAHIVKRTGFETTIEVGRGGGYAAARALDANGRRLATTRAVRL